MSARDSGWLSIFAENVQEAYDNAVIAPKVAEHPDVQLPILTNLDGFILTHAIERMTPMETADVKKFVGEYKPLYPLLNLKEPVTHGLMDGHEYYYEHKYQLVQAMDNALKVFEDTFKEFEKLTGRKYNLVEEYQCKDADYVAVCLGSTFGTMKAAVDQMRKEGKKVGVMMPRVYRPFPFAKLEAALKGKKAVAVMDKHLSVGACGPMFPEVVTAVSDLKDAPRMYNYIYGLGGRDAKVDELKTIFDDMINKKSKKINYLGVHI